MGERRTKDAVVLSDDGCIDQGENHRLGTTREGHPCVLCGGNDFGFVVTGADRMQARDEDYDYVRCTRCGLVCRAPLPSPHDLPELYPDDYQSRIGARERNLDKPINRLAIKYFYGVGSAAELRLVRAVFRAFSGRLLKGVIEPHGGNRLLDIGCGTGAMLQCYRRLGWNVCGVEIDPHAVALCRAKGLRVHQGTVFDAPFPERFDVVLLSHVIEHVLQPVAFLRRSAELVAPAGKLILVTPNIRGIGFALYGSCWYHLDAPRHIFLFNPHTIRLLAEKAGVPVRTIVTASHSQSLCESRHYAETQGARLPKDIAHREAVLQNSQRVTKRHRAYRDLMSPLTWLLSLCGRGDIIEAELRGIG